MFRTSRESYPPTETEPGVGQSLRRTAAAALRYADARFRLLKVDAAEAGRNLKGGVIAIIVAAVFAVLGLLWLIAALTVWFATAAFDGNLAPALAIVGGGFVVFALIGFLMAKKLFSGRAYFQATKEEFKRDKQWLTSDQSNNGSGN